jgi:hypothetical protein
VRVRTPRRVRIITLRGTRERKLGAASIFSPLEAARYCRHLICGNVRSFKELTNGRHEVFAHRCVRNVGLARVRAGVLQTSEMERHELPRRACSTDANVKHRIAELRRGAGSRRKHLCKLSFQLSTSVPELLWRRGE